MKNKFLISIIILGLIIQVIGYCYSETVKADESINNDWWIYEEYAPYTIYQSPSVNWSKFWQVFKNHALWLLEVKHPVSGEWIDANDLLNINRNYTEYNSCKIGLNFTTPDNGITTDWRFTLAIDYRVKDYINKSGEHEYTLRYEVANEYFNLTFNWSDMLQYSGLIFSHGITEIEGYNYFWFRVRRNDIPPNFYIDIDPTYTVFAGASVWTGLNSQRQLVRQSNGTYYCTFYENEDIHIAWSEDEGVTWNDYEVWGLQTSVAGTIAVDSNDIVHLVFYSNKNDVDDKQLEYTNSSSSFTTIVQIRDEDKVYSNPAIAIDSEDRLHVVYEKGETGISNDDQVGYIYSYDNGGTWGTEQILTKEVDNGDDNWYPSIAIDNNDVLHVAFSVEDAVGGLDAIFHMFSSDVGVTWNGWFSDMVVAGTNEKEPCIVIDDNDGILITGDDTASDIFYMYNGTSDIRWHPNVGNHEIDSNGIDSSISVINSESAYIVFEDATLNDIQLYYNDTTGWVNQGIILVGTYVRPSLICSQFPVIGGFKTNRPTTGFAFITAGNTNQNITFYASNDISWVAPILNNVSVISIPYPVNNSIDINVFVNLGITINDQDGDLMDMVIYSNFTGIGTWTPIFALTEVGNGTYYFKTIVFARYGIYYYWNVTVSDGTDITTSDTYNLKTRDKPLTDEEDFPFLGGLTIDDTQFFLLFLFGLWVFLCRLGYKNDDFILLYVQFFALMPLLLLIVVNTYLNSLLLGIGVQVSLLCASVYFIFCGIKIANKEKTKPVE